MLKSRAVFAPLFLAVSLLALISWLYLPGLSGGFYLDDWANLEGLGLVNQGHPPLAYLLDTPVGGSGRPIAYLSFLVQHEHWPANPAAFKLVNLVLHLACAALVSVCGYLVASIRWSGAAPNSRLVFVGLLVGFVWAVLPIHASTVLYVVQRMTQISSLMMLVAFAGYLAVRYRCTVWGRREYALATIAVGIGYLGVFAKEQAVLTGLLILVMEWTLVAGLRPRLNKLWLAVVLVLPALVVTCYLILSNRIVGGYSNRDFTMVERLLTQAVVLWDYVSKIFLPSPNRLNLFNDDFQLSRGLFDSLRTTLSVIGLLFTVVFAVAYRERWPWLSFGVLFFLVGHLLESSFIALEIHFEHRNYLPSIGFCIALVIGLGRFLADARKTYRRASLAGLGLAFAWVGASAVVLSVEASTWGDSRKFAVAALAERPGSLRARQEVAAFLVGAKEYHAAADVLYGIERDFGSQPGVYAQLVMLKCQDGSVPIPDRARLLDVFRSGSFDTGTEVALHDVYTLKRSASENQCTSISWNDLLSFLTALEENAEFKDNSNIDLLRVFVLIEQKRFDDALESIDGLLVAEVSAQLLVFKAKVAGMAGDWALAVQTLAQAEDKFAASVQWLVLGNEVRQLQEDFMARAAADSLSIY